MTLTPTPVAIAQPSAGAHGVRRSATCSGAGTDANCFHNNANARRVARAAIAPAPMLTAFQLSAFASGMRRVYPVAERRNQCTDIRPLPIGVLGVDCTCALCKRSEAV